MYLCWPDNWTAGDSDVSEHEQYIYEEAESGGEGSTWRDQ